MRRSILGAFLVAALVPGGDARAQPAPAEPTPTEPTPTPTAGDAAAIDPGSVQPVGDPATGGDVQEIEPEPVVSAGEGTVIQSIAQRVGLNVFGDATFLVDSEAKPHSTFELGAIGVIMNAEFTETLSAVNEIAFEFVAGDDGLAAPVADVERLQIQYNTRRAHVAMGRLHTEIGYWNTAYHHGRWLQLPIERPRVAQFEDDDGMLPIHSIGVEGSYTVDAGAGSVRLLAALGNGRGRIEDDVLTVVDTNEAKALLVKVETIDVGRRDLRIGASAMFDRIAPFDGRVALPNRTMTEVIANGFVVYRGERLTAIAEMYAVVHDAAVEQWTTLTGFGLVGWDTGRYVPYALVEVRQAPKDVDPFYSPTFDPATGMGARSALADDLTVGAVGTRIELSDWSVVKVQAQVERSAGDTIGAGLVNWSFGI